MMYKETYRDLCHGTDEKSAEVIKAHGFKVTQNKGNWCGKGVYFYDIKKKAWWAADRKCREINKNTGEKRKSKVVFADLVDIEDIFIFDLRVHTNLCEFERMVNEICENHKLNISELRNKTEEIIELRSLLIDFYSDKYNKKIVIGNFRQRPQEKFEHAIEFANSLDMIFGIETIYCVKDISIISNIH